MSTAPSAKQPISLVPVLTGQRFSSAPGRFPLTPLLGREEVLGQVCEMLDADDVRLLTLIGPGGIGKTRLAIEVATRLDPEYAHGACFVPLAPVQAARHVLPTVAQALGIREGGDVPIAELLISVLRDRHELLVLDNFEHVVDAAVPWLGDLLGACPRLKVLVTSRTPLRVTGERRYLVPPLPLPASGSVETLHGNPAARLFIARAVAVRHDFALDTSNADAVRDICHQLDGIPLAIELAAARVNVMSPKEIVARLTDRLTLLRGGSRDLPERHQTMRDAIAWSFELLTEPQQLLFRRLAVFVGGLSLEAAEVMAKVPRWERGLKAIDVLADLIDHSLVRQVSVGTGESRYRMLETIRQFGLEQLTAHDEVASARDAHAGWYLQLARGAEVGLKGHEQVAWLNRLEREHGNIRAALSWLTERERIEEALDLAGSIWFFLAIRGHNAEGRGWYEELVAHPKGADRTVARANALAGLGVIARGQGDASRAQKAHEEAVAILRDRDERRFLSEALTGLGAALNVLGRNDESARAAAEGLDMARELDYAWGMAAARCILGLADADRGDRETAWRHMQESAELSRASGNGWGLSLGLGNLGVFAMAAGDVMKAEHYWQEAIVLINELGDKRGLPWELGALADVDRYRGDYASAERRLEEALSLSRETGDVSHVTYALRNLGRLAALSNEFERAVALLRAGTAKSLQMGSEIELAQCLDAFADLAVATGELERAARLIGSADAMLERGGFVRLDSLPGEHKGRLEAIVPILGDEGYQNAWTGGKALSLEEALAEATAFEPSAGAVQQGEDKREAPEAAAGLSPRELDVLRLMADGLTNQEIADTLFISSRTVANHAANILGKLGLSTRTGVVAYAIRQGLA